MLSKFGKTTSEELASKIEEFSVEEVGINALTTLSQNLPGSEEYKTVVKYVETKAKALAKEEENEDAGTDHKGAYFTKALAKIGRAERYIYHLGRISGLEKRINIMSLCAQASETGQKSQQAYETMSNLRDEIYASDRLKFILNAALRMVNGVNQRDVEEVDTSKHKVSTKGEKCLSLSSLENLQKLKTNGGDTAEAYLIYKIHIHLPEALNLQSDMPSLSAGKDISFPRLQADCLKLKDCVNALTSLVAAEEKKVDATNGKSLENIKKYLLLNESLLNKTETQLKESQQEFLAITDYFGEKAVADGGKETPSTIFGTLEKFFMRISDAVRLAQEKVAKAQRLAAAANRTR